VPSTSILSLRPVRTFSLSLSLSCQQRNPSFLRDILDELALNLCLAGAWRDEPGGSIEEGLLTRGGTVWRGLATWRWSLAGVA